MMSPDFSISDTVYIPMNVPPDKSFEDHYIIARHREKRIYSDEQTAVLPRINPDHPHYKEWIIRRKSCQKLVSYLRTKKKSLQILEVGCGNGWLSHELSKITGSTIIGLDINLTELKQAARVFNKSSKLTFVYGDFLSWIMKDLSFDVIVFAASIQYFRSLPELLNASLRQLYPEGEIHIIDSPFYNIEEINNAKQRSKTYYASLGLPEFANYYFHHSLNDLESFNYKLLFNPPLLINRLFGQNQPFPWVRIKKN